jgi:DnaJ-class molecular chaperone
MEDYYKILDLTSNATTNQINENYNNLINNYKHQPFLTENDKQKFKLIKKAHYVLTNTEYKTIYDTNLNIKQSQISLQPNVINKKGHINNSYIADRIFSINNLQNNNKKLYNIEHSEFLRPKNVGLSSDIKPDIDIPLDFIKTTEVMPFDSNN